MKRFFVIFCILAMVGCSTFGGVKAEDLDAIELRIQQYALVIGEQNEDTDKVIDLLANAKVALDIGDKVKAKEYRDAVIALLDALEGK